MNPTRREFLRYVAGIAATALVLPQVSRVGPLTGLRGRADAAQVPRGQPQWLQGTVIGMEGDAIVARSGNIVGKVIIPSDARLWHCGVIPKLEVAAGDDIRGIGVLTDDNTVVARKVWVNIWQLRGGVSEASSSSFAISPLGRPPATIKITPDTLLFRRGNPYEPAGTVDDLAAASSAVAIGCRNRDGLLEATRVWCA